MRTLFTQFFLLAHFLSSAQNGTWQVFYPSLPAKCLAAQGNTILAGTEGAGLVLFDTLGNHQLVNPANSGIPSLSIQQVAIDAAGQWWIKYPDGVARFDGVDWQAWSLSEVGTPGATFNVLKGAPDGSVYGGTAAGGAAIYKNGAWSVINSSNSGLPANAVRDIAFDATGKTYFATSAGLAIQDGANWTMFNAANTGLTDFNNVKSVAVTEEGIVWATLGLSRFAKYEAGSWTQFAAADIGLTGAGFSGRVVADESGRVWLTYSKSVSMLEAGNWTHYNETTIGCTIPPNPQNSFQLAVDGAGQLWTATCGLTLFDGQTWERQETGNSGLPNGYVFSISEDQDGNTWFGSTGGIGKMDTNGNWSNFAPVDFGATENEVYDILSTNSGDLWFGATEKELLRYDGNDWTLFDTCRYAFPNLFTVNFFVRASAQAPNGDLWFSLAPTDFFGTILAKYSSNGEWSFYDEINSPVTYMSDVEAIVVGPEGTAWFGSTFQGLFQFDGTNWTVFNAGNTDLADDHVHDLAFAPDGALWACTEMGLARFDGTSWATWNTANSGLPSDETYRIDFDGLGGMYVGYDIPGEGPQVAEFRNGEWTELVAPGFENTATDPPFAFAVDSENRLWFTHVYFDLNNSLAPVFRYDPMLTATNENNAAMPQLTIFPNPSGGLLALTFDGLENGPAKLSVRNLQGQVVHEMAFHKSGESKVQTDISHLPSGIYWVTVLHEGLVATAKLVRL